MKLSTKGKRILRGAAKDLKQGGKSLGRKIKKHW